MYLHSECDAMSSGAADGGQKDKLMYLKVMYGELNYTYCILLVILILK